MKRRLVDLLACPRCHGTLAVEAWREEAVAGFAATRIACAEVCALRGTTVDAARRADPPLGPADCAGCYARDVSEGVLRCAGCQAAFPIIEGVPRLLDAALLARMRPRYPDFFARHPEFSP